jgi:hypothetical protein
MVEWDAFAPPLALLAIALIQLLFSDKVEH